VKNKLADRLQAVMRGGNLTLSDLSRWFERPYPTVRQWSLGNNQPRLAPLDDATDVENRLVALEKLIKANRKFPVPRLSPSKRIDYMDEIRRGAGF
jgi:hypothetical protein